MSDRRDVRHGLEPFLESLPAVSGSAGLRVGIVTGLAQLNLRGDPADAAFTGAARAALGQDLPLRANTFSQGDHRVFWLGPDEWLITSPSGDAGALQAGLAELDTHARVAVTNVSSGQLCLRLRGAPARDVLAAGCTLDFHPDVFRVGHCAQSGLARVNILVGLLGDEPEFEVFVRRSHAEYLVHWLRHCGREFGVSFDLVEGFGTPPR